MAKREAGFQSELALSRFCQWIEDYAGGVHPARIGVARPDVHGERERHDRELGLVRRLLRTHHRVDELVRGVLRRLHLRGAAGARGHRARIVDDERDLVVVVGGDRGREGADRLLAEAGEAHEHVVGDRRDRELDLAAPVRDLEGVDLGARIVDVGLEDLPRRGEEVAVVHGRRRLRGDEHGRVGGILKPRLERPGAGVVDRGADRQHHDRDRQRGERHDGTVLVAEERAAENAHRGALT